VRQGAVLLCFPANPPAHCVRWVTDRVPERDIIICQYEESAARRTERGGGVISDQSPVPQALTPEQEKAFNKAEVVLTLDPPFDVRRVAPRLAWVQVIGAGVDHLAGCELDENVVVTNAAGVASVPIAEFVMARVLAVLKRHDELGSAQQERHWVPLYGRDVAGSTIGIIGFGSIGREVARRARAFDMRVLAVRAHPEPSDLADAVVGPDELFSVLSESNVVVLAAPATPATSNLFNETTFGAMRPDSIFCNVARGSLVDEDALVDAVRSGHLAAAILDVTREEPLPVASPLWSEPNIYISAHCAPTVEHYLDNVYRLFADNLDRYTRGEPLRNVVEISR
jgi:phosphoglycerate dehydrogenase-like enzyme